MKYWYTIRESICEEDARKLWQKLSPLNANLTILDDRIEIYGDTDDVYVISAVAKVIIECGYTAERSR